MLNIVELLSLRKLDLNRKIKLVRHQDKRFDISDLMSKNLFERYQSYQSNPVFDCDYIVSFSGMEGSKACMIGVYQVKDRKPASAYPPPADLNKPDFFTDIIYYYILEEMKGFEDLNNRVVIDWGRSPLAWHQWLTEKEVIEILPAGYVKEFPGFEKAILRYDELVSIINAPDANKEWHMVLSSVFGVYLITDMATGKQYVGSASGENGILGRWTDYAKSPGGGNRQLVELLRDNNDYANNFQFSILQTLPRTLTQKEVIEYETLYKDKLGPRAFRLNSN